MEAEAAKASAAPWERKAAALQIYLLGGFEVLRGGAPIPRESWRRRRPADLLKLVALAPGHAVPRDQVIDTLWPDKDPASGANNLHRALYDLRQVLGGRWVDLEGDAVRMHTEAWVDVDAFEAAIASPDAAALPAAVALYRGELSPQDRESQWLAGRRGALRRAFAEAAFRLARAAAERGDAGAAIPLLRRVTEVRPAGEEVHRLLMRLLAEGGRRADALRQYDACELALRAAGKGSPGPETRELREAIRRGEVGPSRARAPFDGFRRAARRLLGTSEPSPLRGRTAVLLLLESMVEQGSGALVLLGERGVGKTRLALEGARIAQERGAVVMAGVAGAIGPAPYALLAGAFADHRHAAGLPAEDPFAEVPGPERSPEEQKLRLFGAVQRSLQAVGGSRPVYLIAEDVHQADESSLSLLHFLARSSQQTRLMLVATCREDEVRAGAPVQMFLSHLDCERLARGVRVQRLSRDATGEQLADVLGSPPSDALARQIYRVTDGSPFYTEELARAFEESGRLPIPEGPSAAVHARVARLGPEVEALLSAAAVAGQRFDIEAARAASGLTAHQVLEALDRCLKTRLVEEDGGGYHFHNSLVREAVYRSLAPSRRVELHRAIADAVEAHPAGGAEEASEALAFHRRAGEQYGAALRHLTVAGHRAAARGGFGEAFRFYAQGLDLADAAEAQGPERLALLLAAGRAQLALADLSGSARSFRAAAELSDRSGWRPAPEERARARHGEALGLVAGGRPGEADPLLELALAEAEGGPGRDAAEILLTRSALAWHAGDTRRAAALADHGAALAAGAGDAALLAGAREAAALAPGEPSLRGARAGAESPALPFDLHLALWERAALGDRPFPEAQAAAALLGERERRRGAARAAAAVRAMEGALALEAGEWDLAESALRDAGERNAACGHAMGEALALERLGALLTARGSVEEGHAALSEGLVVAERTLLRRHALVRLHTALARNRLAAGAWYAAEQWLREASEAAASHGECAVCDGLFRPEAVRVWLARGRVSQAEAEAAELEALVSRRGTRFFGALARAARGRVLAAQGRIDEAVKALSEARQSFLAVSAAYEAARCLAVQARALAAAGEGRAAEAREAQAAADKALAALGASAADS